MIHSTFFHSFQPEKRNYGACNFHLWNLYQRDREYGEKTSFSTLRGLGVSDGCSYRAPGLEGIPDKKE